MSKPFVAELVRFDRETFENEVAIDGIIYENLAILDCVEAAKLSAGDYVAVVAWANSDADTEPYVIVARAVFPKVE